VIICGRNLNKLQQVKREFALTPSALSREMTEKIMKKIIISFKKSV